MKKDVYTFLKEMIIEKVPDIKSVKLWNNQINKGLDWVNLTPCVFIEFRPLEYSNAGAGRQLPEDMRIFLHLVIWQFVEDDLRAFDLSQALYVAMKDNGFNRIAETPDVNHEDVIDFIIEFGVPGYIDAEADDLRNYETLTPKPDLDLTMIVNDDPPN